MNIPKSVPKKYQIRIAHWDDERQLGNSLIVSLKDGWHWAGVNSTPGNHVEGFDTVKEVVDELRNTKTCECETCRKALAAAA